jgi:hypothetical protein
MKDRYTFKKLVEWEPFHFLKIERSTQQTYDKLLPSLSFLRHREVEKIDSGVVNCLSQFWVSDLFPKKRRRESLEKELSLLGVTLRYYRERKNPRYSLPILRDHYRAGDIAKKAKKAVRSLSKDELILFLKELRKLQIPSIFQLAPSLPSIQVVDKPV